MSRHLLKEVLLGTNMGKKCTLQRHKCSKCWLSFSARTSLQQHERVMHRFTTTKSCKMCVQAFTQSYQLELHKKVKHKQHVKKYTCRKCSKKFLFVGSLKAHAVTLCFSKSKQHKKLSVQTKANYSCKQCQENFLGKEAFAKHILTHVNTCAGQTKYPCAECKRSFASKNNLGKHVLKKHPEKLTSEVADDVKNMDKLLVLSHTEKLDYRKNEGKFICDECGKEYKCYSSLHHHSFSHGKPKKHKCRDCDKSFVSTSALRKHAVVHMKNRSFKCETCSKCFKRSDSLRAHELIHKGLNPSHVCSICGNKYLHARNLKDHMYTHTGEKNYICSKCGRAFSCRTGLANHVKIHTGRTKKVQCSQCKKIFSDAWTLKQHMFVHNTAETGVKNFLCSICGKEFTQECSLRRHAKIHTGVKKHVCHVCNKAFIQSCTLKTHLKVHEKRQGECNEKFEAERRGKQPTQKSMNPQTGTTNLPSGKLNSNANMGHVLKELQISRSVRRPTVETEANHFSVSRNIQVLSANSSINVEMANQQTPEPRPYLVPRQQPQPLPLVPHVVTSTPSATTATAQHMAQVHSSLLHTDNQQLQQPNALQSTLQQQQQQQQQQLLMQTIDTQALQQTWQQNVLPASSTQPPKQPADEATTDDISHQVSALLLRLEQAESIQTIGCELCGVTFSNAETLRKHKQQHHVTGNHDQQNIALQGQTVGATNERDAIMSLYEPETTAVGSSEPAVPIPHGALVSANQPQIREKECTATATFTATATICSTATETYANAAVPVVSGAPTNYIVGTLQVLPQDESSSSKLEVTESDVKAATVQKQDTAYPNKQGNCTHLSAAPEKEHNKTIASSSPKIAYKKTDDTSCTVPELDSTAILMDTCSAPMMPDHVDARHPCPICKKTFTHDTWLQRHMEQHKVGRLDCSQCGKVFVNNSRLRQHQQIHAKKRAYQCKICHKTFVQRQHLKKHSLVHEVKMEYECKECGKGFDKPESLDRHVIRHKVPFRYNCDICDSKFLRPSHLRQHLLIHTGEKKHKCDTCDKAFVDPSSLRKHMKVHENRQHKSKDLGRCGKCGKLFTQGKWLAKHLLLHEQGKLTCSYCKRECSDPKTLRRHMLVHQPEKSHVCRICGKGYKEASRLRKHEMIHTNNKPHTCIICMKTFTESYSLRAHMVIHSEGKNYMCTKCGKCFKQNAGLRNHMKIHDIKKHQCKECGRSFTQYNCLLQHAMIHNAADSGVKNYACDICNKMFTQQCSLRRHVKTHTGEKKHHCLLCGKAFIQSCTLKAHMKIHLKQMPAATQNTAAVQNAATAASQLQQHELQPAAAQQGTPEAAQETLLAQTRPPHIMQLAPISATSCEITDRNSGVSNVVLETSIPMASQEILVARSKDITGDDTAMEYTSEAVPLSASSTVVVESNGGTTNYVYSECTQGFLQPL